MSTQFRIAGADHTDTYHVGRRVRAVGTTTGTIYGTITVSAFSTDTTITVEFDSGSLSNESLTISVGILPVENPAYVAGATPIGGVVDYAGSTAPSGWLLAYGQTLNSVANPEYAALYAAIGNTYGGGGATNFNVPDLRGRVVAGVDNMGGSSASRLTGSTGTGVNGALGNAGGSQQHTLSEAEMPAHNHTFTDNNTLYGATGYQVGGTSGNGGVQVSGDAADATSFSGSNNAHNNVQPTFILNKIIRYL